VGEDQRTIEVVVVDDGSTDESAAVIERCSGVRLVRQRNAGLAAARNAGIRESRGDFLVFLDADDRLLPHAVSSGLRALQAEPDAAFVAGGFRRIDEAGHVTAVEPAPAIDGSPYGALLRRSFLPMHGAVLFRRTALVAAGGYDERLPACEDFDLYCRLLRRHPMCRHASIVAEYRRHGGNMSRDARRMASSALTVMGRQWRHARRDPELRAAFDEGVRFWVTAYGNDTAWPAAAGGWWLGGWQALRGAGVLCRHVPAWTAARTVERCRAATARALSRCAAVVRRVGGEGIAPLIALRTREALLPRNFPVPIGHVDLGDLRRTEPVDRDFGFWRGWPVDRHYIDRFIEAHAADVRGRVLEVKDPAYTRRFGRDAVGHADVLDIDPDNPMATIVADLGDGQGIPSDAYDCVILTQTLHVIYDVPAALATVRRILKPGGVVLATVPGISKVDRRGPWYWSFTPSAARRRFEEHFPADHVHVEAHGNVLTATAFLQGMASSELAPGELDAVDPEYPVSVCIRAVKPVAGT
jgi:SAM-dependent methyltransferase